MFFKTMLSLATFGFVSDSLSIQNQQKRPKVRQQSRARGRIVRPVRAELGKETRVDDARGRHAPATTTFTGGVDDGKGIRRGPEPLHFRSDDAPEIPAHVVPSSAAVRNMQLFRRNASAWNDFLDWKSGVRHGPRPDLVYAFSLPGGTAQRIAPLYLTPGLTVAEIMEQARFAWGWDREDRLKVHLLGQELHPGWRLDECGIVDLCSIQISRRRGLVSHPLTDL